MLGAVAWSVDIATLSLPSGRAALLVGGLLTSSALVFTVRARLRPLQRPLLAVALVAVGVWASTTLRLAAVADSPVAALAEQRTRVDVVGVVASDPRPIVGRFEPQVAVRLDVRELRRGDAGPHVHLRAPVLVLAPTSWSGVPLGARVAASGRLLPSDEGDLSALLVDVDVPSLRAPPGVWWRAAGAVRSSLRRAAAGLPADQRALVPALVDGDDGDMDPTLVADFRTTGLTHLTAVSGTNLTLLVGFLLLMARWVGVRGRWLGLVAALGVTGFVLVARGEPSVLRAAVMGSVGLVALSANGRRLGLHCLGVAVLLLVLAQPGLGLQAGFALSVLATAGIVWWAPAWAAAASSWCPRPVALAITVPLAAQIACTPVIAGISGQVSLVAVAANLAADPAVAPATVLGVLAAVVGLVWPVGAALLARPAGWCVAWITVVARHGADLPHAALAWGTGVVALAALTLVCVALVLAMSPLLRRWRLTVGVVALLLVVVAVRWPRAGPPGDWVLVACDVGQGDALAIRAGPAAAVVVDAGPDPLAVDRCLQWLGVESVPLLVLTHFHADHVDGLSGVLHDRRVGRIWTTGLADPPDAVSDVDRAAADAGIRVEVAPPGASVQVGDVTLQQVWPDDAERHAGPGDGSTANGASVVLVARVHGVTLMLCGDIEPPGQEVLARRLPGLDVDVLKVPHHGSRYQDLDWLVGLRPEIALVSVGADNDYGHPAASTLDALTAAGVQVRRTDRDGDLVVLAGAAGPAVRTHRD